MALKGTPDERRRQKADRRVENRAKFVRVRAGQTQGHDQVIVACNAALAASKRASGPGGQEQLARAIAEVVERFEAGRRRDNQ